MQFIKLTDTKGMPVNVRPETIVTVGHPQECHHVTAKTRMVLLSGGAIDVQETNDEVLERLARYESLTA